MNAKRLTVASIQQYLMPNPRPLVCADGFTVLLRAGEAAYCEPQIDNASCYRKIEVSYPSEPVTAFRLYAENKEKLTGTVYRYVPIDIVVNTLNEHGGIVYGTNT